MEENNTNNGKQNDSVDKINVKWKTKLDIYNITSGSFTAFAFPF